MKDNSVFSKENQKIYKNIFADGIKECWSGSHMQEYCVKCNCLFIPFRGNTIIVGLEKPHIQKDFWFGYSDLGQGPSYDECNNRADNAENNAVNYFINENIKSINRKIKKVEDFLKKKNFNWYNFCFDKVYSDESPENPVSYIYCMKDYNEQEKYKDMILTEDELILYLNALKKYRNMFIKRLNTYLKRFGVSKISFQTYWMDR